jgi:uncharacterized membrane protein
MKNILLLLLLAGGLTHCKDTSKKEEGAPQSAPEAKVASSADSLEQIRGLLMTSFGRTGMLDYPKSTMYEITDQTKTLESAYEKAVAPCHYMSESVYAVLTGKFTRTGSTGFKVFDIHKIDTMVAKTPENMMLARVPFEFWCHGNDPVWDIEISHYDGGIFYQNEADGAAWFCPWGPPKIGGTVWTYEVPEAKGITGALNIIIKKEKTTDTKSGKVYDYAVELTVGGKKLKGFAVKGPGKVLGPEGAE